MPNAGTNLVGIPLLDPAWFKVRQFPFFVQPFALLSTDPTQLFLFARAAPGAHAASGIYRMDVPHSVTKTAEISPPTLEVATGDVYVLVAGGTTAGKPDPSVLVGMNSTHLLHRSSASGGALAGRRLPTVFAAPITFSFDASGNYALGPISHDRTVSLAVSPADSQVVAVSGWTSCAATSATSWLAAN